MNFPSLFLLANTRLCELRAVWHPSPFTAICVPFLVFQKRETSCPQTPTHFWRAQSFSNHQCHGPWPLAMALLNKHSPSLCPNLNASSRRPKVSAFVVAATPVSPLFCVDLFFGCDEAAAAGAAAASAAAAGAAAAGAAALKARQRQRSGGGKSTAAATKRGRRQESKASSAPRRPARLARSSVVQCGHSTADTATLRRPRDAAPATRRARRRRQSGCGDQAAAATASRRQRRRRGESQVATTTATHADTHGGSEPARTRPCTQMTSAHADAHGRSEQTRMCGASERTRGRGVDSRVRANAGLQGGGANATCRASAGMRRERGVSVGTRRVGANAGTRSQLIMPASEST